MRTIMNHPDYLGNEHASQMLAGKIKAYWNKRGKFPSVWVQAEDGIFGIRSTMLNGRPL